MARLGLAIHESLPCQVTLLPSNSWVVGPSPTMTEGRWCPRGLELDIHIQRIPRRAHGAHQVGGVADVDGFAQAADVDVDGARLDIDVAAPHVIEQLLAAEHPSLVLQEEAQQAELGRAEMYVLLAAPHPVRGEVH